ncbi:MAG TPA: hypothetical protein VMF69_01755 [Gemmataceae bacterium]|nr:hypothetical protein [Gemmataceae bacterium]
MRIYLTLPALAFAALLSLGASGAQAGKFFGPAYSDADYSYQCPNRSPNPFGWGPGAPYQARHQHSRHRLFHRDKGVANDSMPTNAMPGYGMPPVYGMPFGYVQNPIVQSPILPPAVQMTSVAPAPAPVAPAVLPHCLKCGQTGQIPAPVPAAPAVQPRIVPVPARMLSGPTTAEPPPAEPTGKPPF